MPSAYFSALSECSKDDILSELSRRVEELDALKADNALLRKGFGMEIALSDVTRFSHEIIGLPVPEKPTQLNKDRASWAVAALTEEITEFAKAYDDNNMAEQVDALIDLSYFAMGRLVEMGVSPGLAWADVQEANMKKVRGAEMAKRPGSLGYEAHKPHGWVAPKHRHLEPPKPKLLILGHGRHGKDTAAELLSDQGFSFIASSVFCAETVVWPAVNKLAAYECFDHGPPADPWTIPNWTEAQRILDTDRDAKDCFLHRHHSDKTREFWYKAISEFNQPDRTALGRAIFDAYDIYCGLRNYLEFHALKNNRLFDFAIWIDRSEHEPPEPSTSISVEPWMADFVVDNNGDIDQLTANLEVVLTTINKEFNHG